jgi:hypothetical protein
VEVPIDMDILNNVSFVAFIDLVLKDRFTGRYKIFDFKTARTEWNNAKKEDESKYSQVLLYKAFYSKKFNVNIDEIDVEFFILKRKLWENVSYPQSRIQTFVPKNSQAEIAVTLQNFIKFVKNSFTPEGEYIKDEAKYPKIAGEKYKNCEYCVHKKVNCFPKKSDQKPILLKEN